MRYMPLHSQTELKTKTTERRYDTFECQYEPGAEKKYMETLEGIKNDLDRVDDDVLKNAKTAAAFLRI